MTCEKAKICNKCMAGFYLKHHTSPLAKNYTCEKCIANCDQCTNSSICEVCSVGYYKDASSKCSMCSSIFTNCVKCILQRCETCKDNTYFVGDSGKC